jgi:hypothetical protein
MGFEGLDFRVVPLAFTEGQDTRTQSKLVIPSKWAQLINYSLSADNTPRRRDGSAAIASAVTGNGLALCNDELVVVAGSTLQTVETAAATTSFKSGTLANVFVSKDEINHTLAFNDSPDCASGSGYSCYAWLDFASSPASTPTVNATLVEESSGAKIIANKQVSAAAFTPKSPRVVFAGGAFYILCVDTTNNALQCVVIDVTSPATVGTPVNLSAGVQASNIDACPTADGTGVCVAYVKNAGANSIEAVKVTRAGTVPSASAAISIALQANVARASVDGLSCSVTTGHSAGTDHNGIFYMVGAGGAAGINGTIVNASFAVSTAQTVIDATAPAVDAPTHVTSIGGDANNWLDSKFFVTADQQSSYNTADFRPLRALLCDSTLVVTLPAAAIGHSSTFDINAARASGPQGPFIAGKPFDVHTSISGRKSLYLPVMTLENFNKASLGANCTTQNEQCNWFLWEIIAVGTNLVPVVAAHALRGSLGLVDPTLGGAAPIISTPCSVSSPSSGVYSACVEERGRLELVNGFNFTPVGLCRLKLTPNETLSPGSAQLGQTLLIPGGGLTAYDGQRVAEHGFYMFPEGISCVVNATGLGTGLTVGVHQIVAVYEWTNNVGELVQSAPSLAQSVTVANTTDEIAVIIPSLLMSLHGGTITAIALYMTAASGTTFFRVPINAFAPLLNNGSASTVTTTIAGHVAPVGPSTPDTSLTANEPLYTQPDQAGTTLQNDTPPPMNRVWVSQNRLWFNVADQPLVVGYSQEPVPNVGLQFSDELFVRLPATSGGFVAGAELDEKTIVFCSRKIYVIYGSGPNSAGENSTYSEPQEVPTPVGCLDARSVLRMPQGLMFKAQGGFYLLGRDLSVKYIGDGVKAYDGYTVVSATLMQDRQECRFEAAFSPGVSGDGVVLVFSYLLDQWSVFFRGTSALHPTGAADAIWWPAISQYAWLATLNGAVLTSGLFSDIPLFNPDGSYTGANPDDFVGVSSQGVFGIATTAWLKASALEGFQRVRRLYITGSTPFSGQDALVTISVAFNDDATLPGAYSVATNISSFTNTAAIDLRHKLQLQKCKSVRFTFSCVPQSSAIAGFGGIQAMALEIGFKRGVNKLPSGQTV